MVTMLLQFVTGDCLRQEGIGGPWTVSCMFWEWLAPSWHPCQDDACFLSFYM